MLYPNRTYRNDLTWSYILVQPYLVLRHKMNLAPWFSQFVQSAVIVAWSHDLHWRGRLHIEKLSLVPYQNDQTNHLKYNINIYALFIVIWKIFIILHILNILPIVIVSGSASIWLHSNIIKMAVNCRYLGGRRKQHILDFFISRDSKKIKDIVE